MKNKEKFEALLARDDLSPDEVRQAFELGYLAAQDEVKEATRREFDERKLDAAFQPEDDPELGGNVYRPVQHYLTMPTWWRKFMFRLLKPRDVVGLCPRTGVISFSRRAA